jgi:hypothetical protein
MVGDIHMAVVVATLEPPAIVEQVRYRRRYHIVKAHRRRVKAETEPGVSPWYENVIVEEEVLTEKGPVIFIVKPIVNPDQFEERWQAMGGKKGDRLR